MSDRVFPVKIAGHGDMAELARQMGRLRYDALAVFMAALAEELRRQAAGDRARGRTRLPQLLEEAARGFEGDAERMRTIFRLCAPYLQDDLRGRPPLFHD